MKFLIVTHARHFQEGGKIWSYGPYVREMNLWGKYVDSLIIVAPVVNNSPSDIDLSYDHKEINLIPVPEFNIRSIKSCLYSIISIPSISYKILTAMKVADHIHLRCPGNIGLLGVLIQIFFPKKKKTAKYAGNWDWRSDQPFSYRLQQYLLRNTFLTKNMKTLVYGNWPDKTNNILPFFTASYSIKQYAPVEKKPIAEKINLIFVGVLGKNKRPIIALQVLRQLIDKGYNANLTYCGDGVQKELISSLISEWDLVNSVSLLGNVNSSKLIEEYKKAHFLIFPSESEGWPKVVAEAMWWGCIPLTTGVSCVPEMLNFGERGFIIKPLASEIAKVIIGVVADELKISQMRLKGVDWSRQFTLEKFESQIYYLIADESCSGN